MAHSVVSSLDLERGASPPYDLGGGMRQPISLPSSRSTSRQTCYSRPLHANSPTLPPSPMAATFRTESLHSGTSEANPRPGRSVSQPNAIKSRDFSPKARFVPPMPPPPVFSAPSPQPPPRRSRASTGNTTTTTSKLSYQRARSVDLLEASKLSQQMKAYSSETSFISDVALEKKRSRSNTLNKRVFEAGSADLLYDLAERKGLKKQTHGVLDLTTLEKMSIYVLQSKLTEQVKALGEKRAWMDVGIEKTLHDYCTAIRDLDYMEQCAGRGVHEDPFLIKTSKGLESKLLEDADLVFEKDKKLASAEPENLAHTLIASKRDSWIRQRLTALVMALAGGMALIGPFLIMTLIDGELARLITTCGFMLIVAFAIAIGSDWTPDKVALLTAAYAAALVIYAGNNPPSLMV